MFSEFVFSIKMQIILAFLTFIETFCTMYMISNDIMTVFQVKFQMKKKLLFAFINGTVLQTAFVYAIYILGGFIPFSPFVYLLVVNVNPFGALVYYFSALWIFKLSAERSVKLMSYTPILWATKVAFGRFLHDVFNLKIGPVYNYVLDGVQRATTLVAFSLVYVIIQRIFIRSQASLKFCDNMFLNKKKELFIYFLQATFIFAVNVTIPSLFEDQIAAGIIVISILLLHMVIHICLDVVSYNRQVIGNHDVNINALFQGMEELRGIKHDFNNILHTYSGYLELKEFDKLQRYHTSLVSATSHAGNIMELAQKTDENPPLISLLISKLEYAKRINVKFLVSLKCSLGNLYIDNMDLSRVLSCLLDNAIEVDSKSEQQRAYLTVESKVIGSKLMIVTNSMPANADQSLPLLKDSRDFELQIVRSIVNKYGNCLYQLEYHNQERSAYIELQVAQ